MFKKLCYALIIVTIISLVSISAFAAVDIYNPDTPATTQSILKITRPSGNENTYNKTYEICGFTDKENVHVDLLVLKGNVYEKLADINGQSSWDNIGVLFVKEVALTDGANKIRIVAYTKANSDQKQISDFTVSVVNNESLVDKIKNGIINILDNMLNK